MNTHAASASSFSLHLKLFVGTALCLFAFALMPAPAHAASLTQTQIDAVLNLLVAFDVPQATVDNVRAILGGQSEGHVSASAPAEEDAAPQANAVRAARVPASPLAPAVARAPVARPAPVTFGFKTKEPSLAASIAMVPVALSTDSINMVADQIMEINNALVNVGQVYGALFSLGSTPRAQAAAMATAPVAGESFFSTLAYMPESLYETATKTTDFLAAVEMAPLYVITEALSDALFKAGLY